MCCNGARRNAWASGMQRDMGRGRVVYLLDDSRRPPSVPTLGLAPAEQVVTVQEQKDSAVRSGMCRLRLELWWHGGVLVAAGGPDSLDQQVACLCYRIRTTAARHPQHVGCQNASPSMTCGPTLIAARQGSCAVVLQTLTRRLQSSATERTPT